jgi:hypothetical protein
MYKPLDTTIDSTSHKRAAIIRQLIIALQPYTHLKTLRKFTQDQDQNYKIRKDFNRYINIPTNSVWSISLYPNYFTINYTPRLTTGEPPNYTDINGKVHSLMWLDIDSSKTVDGRITVYTNSRPVESPSEVILACQEYLLRNSIAPTHDVLSIYTLERWLEGQFNDRELTEAQYKALKISVIKTLDKYSSMLRNTPFKSEWPW